MMKLTTNKRELKKLDACASGYKTFIDVHGEKDATLSQCLKSNGWNDVWWLISETYSQFSDQQKIDLRLLACDYALSSIDNFEAEYPEDKRPRLAIEASILFANGDISEKELSAAESAAAESARSAAARSAARSAESAESAAARSAESAAARSAAARSAESAAARSAESAAARSAESAAARSARSAAWSAARSANEKMLNDLFLKWEL